MSHLNVVRSTPFLLRVFLGLFLRDLAAAQSILDEVGQYIYYGCQTEAVNGRALTSGASASDAMTLEVCEASCAGDLYFGTEYGRECYCGNSFASGSIATSDSDCNFPCAGDATEFCGAGNRLSVYKLNGTATSTSVVSTPSAVTPVAVTLPTGWAYQGCWTDGVNGRILTASQQPDSQTLTVESCVAACAALSYTIAGAEYGSQCFCDKFISNGGALSTNQDDCNMPCSGSASETCGAGNRLSLYSIGTPQVFQPPSIQRDLPGSWTYQGCLQDNLNDVRTFPFEIINTDNNTATVCLEQCQAFGYNAAGLEYGIQCFCGDIENINTVGAAIVDDSQCGVPCSGNATTLCGGNNLLSYYSWTGAPLYSWDFRTGTEAGEYSLLIGGVCIPLMTAQTVNGKVTFVEKFGTGEPNSTGAYELDLSVIDNVELAWRPMHVKTDVFCSGGLILPDKVGRQVNVGGWSGDSNFGVRLYWPDGSAGVWGTNDWQEDVTTIHLLVARWYPSAMIMANGSILVVGGEIGSNAAASPTLELLPATGGGTVFLDFLARTDPNNLYPFLCVLPSGIFIAYWNEARILDQVTFETIKTLPNIPGAVNNFLGGRSYPLEGTMVLLPQHAPYTEPLTVLICGGSTAGPGYAIDNCVSTQPEAANPVWLIERMPSARVMPCMAGLPDGTYLILNGAQHGVAGFGLASNPNLNALLYNPSAPPNARISIMANTTVARLYHSEAILLLDGRILVSGSDPQDGVHPEEYRVEVFTPPYLLSGLPRPTFTLQDTDWSYGETVTLSLTSALTGAVSVSLLGGVVSTHGNSMGQRTLFPAVTCAGSTCSVTVPPNTGVAPPGWYMLFVNDGPTPSVGQWVRVGGDPAELGNWPAANPAFTVPGV